MGSTARSDALVRSTSRRTHPWPFMVQQPEPVTVNESDVGVPRRQEVEFADGSRLWLLRVERDGVPDLFLRELPSGMRVDLRHLAPTLAADLAVASSRDVPGIVHFSLRARFPGRQALLDVAVGAGGSA